jgi:hypothetical protein
MSALSWLDNLTTQVGNVAGRAVDVVGTIATQSRQADAAQTEQRAALPVSTVQAPQGNDNKLYLAVGIGLLLLTAVVMLRK